MTIFLFAACGEETPTPTPTPTLPAIERYKDEEFGLTWVNRPDDETVDRTTMAQQAQATWDRWPVRWYWVEQPTLWGEGEFAWSGFLPLTGENFNITHAVEASGDVLKPLVILEGIPRLYDCAHDTQYPTDPDGTRCSGSEDRIEGLGLDAVVDGSINEENRWAFYVYNTIQELLSKGVTHYEIWNEPEIGYWNKPNDPATSTSAMAYADDYATMVKASLDAADEVSDESVKLILGGPMSDDTHYQEGGWVYNAWMEVQQRGFHTRLDGVAFHSYGWTFFTPLIAKEVRSLIPGSPLWITESGLAIDFCQEGHFCATTEQQVADYFIQQYAYARVSDAEVIFHHRLQDDNADDGDFGIYADTGSSRVTLAAAQVASQYLQGAQFVATDSDMPQDDRESFKNYRLEYDHIKLVFEQPNNRVTVLWAHDTIAAYPVKIDAWGASAWLVDSQGAILQEWCNETNYIIDDLPGAPAIESLQLKESGYEVPVIGGPVRILIESNEPCTSDSSPIGSASLICENGQVVGTQLTGYDEFSGLASLTQVC